MLIIEIQDHLQKTHYSRLECTQFARHLELAQLSNVILQEPRALCSGKEQRAHVCSSFHVALLFVFNKDLLLMQRKIIPWHEKVPLQRLKMCLKSRQTPRPFWVIAVLPLCWDAQSPPPYIWTPHRTTLRKTALVYELLATPLSALIIHVQQKKRLFQRSDQNIWVTCSSSRLCKRPLKS